MPIRCSRGQTRYRTKNFPSGKRVRLAFCGRKVVEAKSIKGTGGGWHGQTIRHSNARRTGTAGGAYADMINRVQKRGYATDKDREQFSKTKNSTILKYHKDAFKPQKTELVWDEKDLSVEKVNANGKYVGWYEGEHTRPYLKLATAKKEAKKLKIRMDKNIKRMFRL